MQSRVYVTVCGPSVRLSVPSIDGSSDVRRVCCWALRSRCPSTAVNSGQLIVMCVCIWNDLFWVERITDQSEKIQHLRSVAAGKSKVLEEVVVLSLQPVVKLLSKRWWIPIGARLEVPKLEPGGLRAEVGFPTADQGFSSIRGTLLGFYGV